MSEQDLNPEDLIMTDDIVERLLKIAPIHHGRVGHECISEAADKIKMLRAEIKWLEHSVIHLSQVTGLELAGDCKFCVPVSEIVRRMKETRGE